MSRRKVYFRLKSPSFYSDEMLSLEISIINTVSAVLISEGGGGGVSSEGLSSERNDKGPDEGSLLETLDLVFCISAIHQPFYISFLIC